MENQREEKMYNATETGLMRGITGVRVYLEGQGHLVRMEKNMGTAIVVEV